MTAYIFLADGFEEIEAITPIDILRRAGIETVTVSISENLRVVGAHHIAVEADCLFSQCDFANADALILPGGLPGTTNLGAHQLLLDLLKRHHVAEKLTAAICAAPSILGKLNLLDGKEAICYPSFEKALHGATISGSKVVRSGNIITAKAAGVATEFALEVVATLKGTEEAQKIAQAIHL
jgi:4-methyl-5(b-hydroxyethyl)-thiazole monophosphate biosynthesis